MICVHSPNILVKREGCHARLVLGERGGRQPRQGGHLRRAEEQLRHQSHST